MTSSVRTRVAVRNVTCDPSQGSVCLSEVLLSLSLSPPGESFTPEERRGGKDGKAEGGDGDGDGAWET